MQEQQKRNVTWKELEKICGDRTPVFLYFGNEVYRGCIIAVHRNGNSPEKYHFFGEVFGGNPSRRLQAVVENREQFFLFLGE